MKLSRVWVGCALLACAGVAQAAVITVANGSFETPGVLTTPGSGNDEWLSLPAPGAWQYTANTNTQYGLYKIGTGGGAHFTTAADGIYVANLGAAGTITQSLSSYTVNAGDVFTLDFYVSKGLQGSGSGGSGNLTASILVGTTDIASNGTGIVTNLAAGVWEHKTVTGTATTTGPLSISFAPVASSPWLDNVTLSVSSAVPEPTSLSLLALSGLAMLRRRK